MAVLWRGAAAGGFSFSISDDDNEVDEEVADDFTARGLVAALCGGAGGSVGARSAGAEGGSVTARVTGAGSGSDSTAFFSVYALVFAL